MTLKYLTARPARVRELYAQRETARTGHPWSRAELAQGFVGDVGDLMKLVMAKEGRRVSAIKDNDAALAHELADCLWSVLVLADSYGINLELEFARTMDQLETKLLPAKNATARPRTRTARTSRGRRG